MKYQSYLYSAEGIPKSTKVPDSECTANNLDEIKYNFNSIKDAEKFVDDYQTINTLKFSVYKTEAGFKMEGNIVVWFLKLYLNGKFFLFLTQVILFPFIIQS